MRGFLLCLVMTRGNEFGRGESSSGVQGGGTRNRETRINGAVMRGLIMEASDVMYACLQRVKSIFKNDLTSSARCW